MDDRRKRVNIKDVARLAGVSPTTVSHALGGQRPVSEATRQRVQEAVAELGYRPHPGARSLKASGTGVIALCAVNATSSSSYADLEYYFRIIQGVTEVAHQQEYALVVIPDSRNGVYWDRLLFDGAIISDPVVGRRQPQVPALAGPALRDHRPRPRRPGRGLLGRRRRRDGDADWSSTTSSPAARATSPSSRG